MATAAFGKSVSSSGNAARLSGISWRTYLRLLCAFEDQPGYRLTFDRGELEIMSPSLLHDERGRFLGLLVYVLAEELGLPFRQGGSTTLKRKLLKKGVEPDESFWFENAPRLAGKDRLDLRTDPPPDLILEVDVSSRSLEHLPIYAALGVPECWVVADLEVRFHVLDTAANKEYRTSEASRAFPFLRGVDLRSFLERARDASDQTAVVRDFRKWVQDRQP